MADWTYFNPVKIVFALGALSRLAEHVPFQRVVLVTSPGFTRRGTTARTRESLGGRLIHVLDDVRPNPDVRDIDIQARGIRELQPDCILALGGGSSMDTAKALARLLTQPESSSITYHFREGREWQDTEALPLVTIPTTSGTGSEVTPFATVWDFEERKKYSVTGNDLYAHTAILDPELIMDLPRDVTISSGLDAVSHAFESTWNRRASPVTLSLAVKSLQLSLRALPRLNVDQSDISARSDMMQASLLAGLAISQTRTALAHSISYPLTAHFGLPHGVACSFTLPEILRFNAEADDGRLQDLANAIGCDGVDNMINRLVELGANVGSGRIFFTYVSDPESVMALSGNMLFPGRSDNNMRGVDLGDIERIVAASLYNLEAGR